MLDIVSVVSLMIVAVLAGSVLAFQFLTGVPPMPARAREIADVVALLKRAAIPPQAIIYEMGCGWGSLVRGLATAFPRAQIRGIELSPLPYLVARFRTRNMPNVHLQRRDFYTCDLRDADAVTCYLMIKPMPRMAAFLDDMLCPGTPVVSIAFRFRERQPIGEAEGMLSAVALYFWPARRMGADRASG